LGSGSGGQRFHWARAACSGAGCSGWNTGLLLRKRRTITDQRNVRSLRNWANGALTSAAAEPASANPHFCFEGGVGGAHCAAFASERACGRERKMHIYIHPSLSLVVYVCE